MGCGAAGEPAEENTLERTGSTGQAASHEPNTCPSPGGACDAYLGHAATTDDCSSRVTSYTAYGLGDNIQLRSQDPTFCRNAPSADWTGCDEYGPIAFCKAGEKCKLKAPGQAGGGCSGTTGAPLGYCGTAIDGLPAARCDVSPAGVAKGLDMCYATGGFAWKTYKKKRGYVQGVYNPGVPGAASVPGMDPIEGVANRDLIAAQFKNPCGLVEYRAEVDLLMPRTAAQSNNTVLWDVVTRGFKFSNLHFNGLMSSIAPGLNAPGYENGRDPQARAAARYNNPRVAGDAGDPFYGQALFKEGWILAFGANSGDQFSPSVVNPSGAACSVGLPGQPPFPPQGSCTNGHICATSPGTTNGVCLAPAARVTGTVAAGEGGRRELLLLNKLRTWTKNTTEYAASGGWQDPNGLATTNSVVGKGDAIANGFPWAANAPNSNVPLTRRIYEDVTQDRSRGGGVTDVGGAACTTDNDCGIESVTDPTAVDRIKCYKAPGASTGQCVPGCGMNEQFACGVAPGLVCDCSAAGPPSAEPTKCRTIPAVPLGGALPTPTATVGGTDCRLPPAKCQLGSSCDGATGLCQVSAPKSDQGTCKCPATTAPEVTGGVMRCVNRTQGLGQGFANPSTPNGLNTPAANASGAELYWYRADLFAQDKAPNLCTAVKDPCLTELGGAVVPGTGPANTQTGRCGQVKWKTQCNNIGGACADPVGDPALPGETAGDTGVSWVNPTTIRLGKSESHSGGLGFLTDRVYVVCYTAQKPIVQGLSYPLMRDSALFMKKSPTSPLASYQSGGSLFMIGYGLGNGARALKDFTYRGYNEGRDPTSLTTTVKVFDGIIPFSAGAKRQNMNELFVQSTRTPWDTESQSYSSNGSNQISANSLTSPPPPATTTNTLTDWNVVTQSDWPLTWTAMAPPRGFAATKCNNTATPAKRCVVGECSLSAGEGICIDGLARLCSRRGNCPNVMEQSTENDFWQNNAAALSMYQNRTTGVWTNVPDAGFSGQSCNGVRLYYHGGTQMNPSSIGTTGNPASTYNKAPGREVQNMLSYDAQLLWTLQKMRKWVKSGRMRNFSKYPQVATSVTESQFHAKVAWKSGARGIWTRSTSTDPICTGVTCPGGTVCTKVGAAAVCRQTAVNIDRNGDQMPCGSGFVSQSGVIRSPCPYSVGWWENTSGISGTFGAAAGVYNQPGHVGDANLMRVWNRAGSDNKFASTEFPTAGDDDPRPAKPYPIDATHLKIDTRLPNIDDKYGNACSETASGKGWGCSGGSASLGSVDLEVPIATYSGRSLRSDGSMGGSLVNCTQAAGALQSTCTSQATFPAKLNFLSGSRRPVALREGDRWSSGVANVGTLMDNRPAFCTTYGCAKRYENIRECYSTTNLKLDQCIVKAGQSNSKWYISCASAPECQ